MSDGIDHLTIGEMPEEYTELEDGSVEITELEPVNEVDDDFYANLAESIEEGELTRLANDLIELVEKDKKARERRDKQYEEGIRRTGLGDDAPGGAEFEGASRVVHPVMAEMCVDFASSAIKELFPPTGPVRTNYIGDITKEERERGNRKRDYMNWQLTKQMPEYVDELEQLLSQMPLGGSQYLKFRPDEDRRRPVVEFIPIDEIFLPYSSNNFYTSPRITHRQMISKAVFEDRVDSGFYRDVNAYDAPEEEIEQSSAKIATDKIEGIEDTAYNEDGLRAVLEIYVWRKLESDQYSGGDRAPYIIHLDETTEKVLAVYRNWDEQDPSMEKLDWIVEFKFIPWRGAYAIGLPHLIGGISAALTGSLRALLDSAHINNAASMLKLKSGRVVGQNTQVNITEVTEIEAPAGIDDIRKIAMPMPFNPPSPVLFQMLGFLTQAAKETVTTSEEKIAEAGNQMPVGTAMALIEQGSKVFSAIHARLHRSQAKALEILHRINAKWLDEEEQVNLLGKVLATREDFAGSLNVVPASDPNIFSESQRYAQIQALLQMAQDQRVPWNVANIYHRMMDLMHIQQPEELLQKPKEPLTSSVADENIEGLHGTPIKAEQSQDHMAHIQGHLAFISSPLQLDNPLVPPQALQAFLGHIEEHIQMLSAVTTGMVLQQLAAQMVGMPEEQVMVQAIQQSQAMLAQQLAPVFQQIGAVQQKLQQRTPPPQMPPEVQASIQIAQMDTQRKAQYDQAIVQIKQAELQANQQRDVGQFQAEQARIQFEQQMAFQRQQAEATAQQFQQYMLQIKQQAEAAQAEARQFMELQIEQLRQQVELLKNREDNERSQRTELLKNRDDNETKLLIAGMEQAAVPDVQPQLDELNGKLDELNQREIREALDEALEAMNENSAKKEMD